MEREDTGIEEERELEGRHRFELAHCVGATIGRLVAGFEGSRLYETEDVHAEFFQVFGEDELAWWMGAGEGLAVAGEDVNGFFGEGSADIFKRFLCHACSSWSECQQEVRRRAKELSSPSFAIMLTTASWSMYLMLSAACSLTLATVFVHRTRRSPLDVVYSRAHWK